MFLDGLTHGIDMKRMIHPFRILPSKHIQRLALRRCGKCEERKILMHSLSCQFIQKTILIILTVLFFLTFHLSIFLQDFFRVRKCSFKLLGGITGLRRMSFVNYNGKPLISRIDFFVDYREFLKRSDDNSRSIFNSLL